MMEHKHAALLRMAADNADQLFECEEWGKEWGNGHGITQVIFHPHLNWRPVNPEPKKIKRWLWADKDGCMLPDLYSEKEIKKLDDWKEYIKLLWSETIFEVEE